MLNFFDSLPELVFRKIYKLCDTQSKYDLSTALKQEGKTHVIDRAGAHNHKETIWCFLCQFECFYRDFGDTETRLDNLGFHYLYQKESSFYSHTFEGQLTIYEIRKNNAEDRKESDKISMYFEHKLEQCYNTKKIEELRNHIIDVHWMNDYLPIDFWKENSSKQTEAREAALELWSNVPHTISHEEYHHLVDEHKTQKANTQRCVNETLNQLAICQSIGATWPKIYLKYDGQEELWNSHKAVNCFRLFLEIIERNHGKAKRLYKALGWNFKTLGRLF